jgi:hypothetical protein
MIKHNSKSQRRQQFKYRGSSKEQVICFSVLACLTGSIGTGIQWKSVTAGMYLNSSAFM